MTDVPLDRAAIHGTVTSEDVPSDVTLTNDEEVGRLVEILYRRDTGDYVACEQFQSLHIQPAEPREDFEVALSDAVNYAQENGLPILRTVYSWTPVTNDSDLGSDRLPRPWLDDGEE